jgi:hypothetical protein
MAATRGTQSPIDDGISASQKLASLPLFPFFPSLPPKNVLMTSFKVVIPTAAQPFRLFSVTAQGDSSQLNSLVVVITGFC